MRVVGKGKFVFQWRFQGDVHDLPWQIQKQWLIPLHTVLVIFLHLPSVLFNDSHRFCRVQTRTAHPVPPIGRIILRPQVDKERAIRIVVMLHKMIFVTL